MGILQIFTLLGALGMFLYGMNLMSSGLQKAAGERLRLFLSAMTSNPFKGVLTGLGITSVIQSSSATTVMVVSFVNAGLLTLAQSIGVIMGANIGTTVTAWFVSWLGFKADISILAIPFMLFGFLFSNSKKDRYKNVGEFIVGFSLLFLGLSFMKESVPDLGETPEVLNFVMAWSGYGFLSVLIFLCFGTVLTLILQSSSATMAITLIMLSMGWIPFDMACAMVLGENIGTTITANIAAWVGNTSAKRAAMSHTLFNVFGVIWALLNYRKTPQTKEAFVSLIPVLFLSSMIAILNKLIMSYSGENPLLSACWRVFILSFIIGCVHICLYIKKKQPLKALIDVKTLCKGSILILLITALVCKSLAMLYTQNPAYVSCIVYLTSVWIMLFSYIFPFFELKKQNEQVHKKYEILFIVSIILLILATH